MKVKKGSYWRRNKNNKNNSGFQLREMLEMQDAINSKIDANWKDKKRLWHKAVYMEACELVGHTDWKWWKKSEVDLKQIELELVDIWHFLLSWSICEELDLEYDSEIMTLFADFGYSEECEEDLIVNAAQSDFQKTQVAFFRCMKKYGLDLDRLYTLYVAKNTLNKFRSDNGYKDGTYIKVWNGKEDNEVLYSIVEDFRFADGAQDKIYSELQSNYNDIKETWR